MADNSKFKAGTAAIKKGASWVQSEISEAKARTTKKPFGKRRGPKGKA